MKTSKQGAGDQQRSRQEIEDCVTFVRLELYNRDRFCGPKAVRERMKGFYHVSLLPSERTIARILSRCGLTHGRTGFYLE
jgi:hypothetical protein